MIINNINDDKPSSERRSVRLISSKNIKVFQQLIANMTWMTLYYCENVNEAYEIFASKINLCFNASFPIVRLSPKCARDKMCYIKH